MGPCPPPGLPHHYTLEVYALDTKLDIPATSGRDDLQKAIAYFKESDLAVPLQFTNFRD